MMCSHHHTLGAGKDDADISAVRSNFPFRPQCGLFYFEVEIISKGVDGHIGIGFCWSNSTLDRLPGTSSLSSIDLYHDLHKSIL